MAIYRRPGSPYFYVDVQIHGRRVRQSTRAQTREAAKLVEKTLREEIVAEAAGSKPKRTLDEALGRYWLERGADLAGAYNVDWQSDLLLAQLGKDTRLDMLTDDMVSTYVAKRRASVKNATVNRELALLRHVMRRAQKAWGWAVATIDWPEHFLREAAPRDRYLTPEEARKLIAAAAPHLKPAIEISLLTGLRRADVLGLDWSQIDLKARTIRVRQKSALPGGKPHTVPICQPLLVLLANLVPRDEGLLVLSRPDKRRKLKAVPMRSVKTAFKAACRRAGVKGFRWHDLRHTAASWMVQSGVPLEVVRDVLGHANIATTLRYAHHAGDAKARAVAALAAHYRMHAEDEILGTESTEGASNGKASA